MPLKKVGLRWATPVMRAGCWGSIVTAPWRDRRRVGSKAAHVWPKEHGYGTMTEVTKGRRLRVRFLPDFSKESLCETFPQCFREITVYGAMGRSPSR